ncbi:uncharacterized protein LOC124837324 isoform X1 [Vigna umbellata]|uniref:uncharacterized protein LOC124837323 isoform X1 n=1 Tax=Vigna umbellata TaxID=87088 RepID=UPI001F5FAF64|nr:uncharacterized protein LOC124837323 isoform X1 [Vigna umbellata]XP_047168608.1 uncharacterized protein LOC124837324 isoform X1 [Vigna umbellata]
MEEPVIEQSSSAAATASSGNTARPRLQKYALRSGNKSKEDKSDNTPNFSNPCESKSFLFRGRSLGASSVSKSVSVLDFSGKEKSGSAKPPRRLSIPAKAPATSRPKLGGNITPISETRTLRSALGQGRSKTPISDISKTTKLNLLTSASYWLNQIKLSETASKHSISLAFFKLALEAGCEPLGPMQEELKSYVRRHQLDDGIGETVKSLFERYGISESMEQLQLSETISHVPEEGTRSSDDDVHSSSSTTESRKLKPRSLNSTKLTPSTESTKNQKSNLRSSLRGNFSTSTNNTTPRTSLDKRNNRLVKKSEKPSKQESNKEKGMVKKQEKKSDVKEAAASAPKSNKENMQTLSTEEISVAEVV